jgi:hypothetical protein
MFHNKHDCLFVPIIRTFIIGMRASSCYSKGENADVILKCISGWFEQDKEP